MRFFLTACLFFSLANVLYAFEYPYARRQVIQDSYAGVFVTDPYRWLEETTSTDVNRWIERQEKLSADYLGKLPNRAQIQERIAQLHNYVTFGIPKRAGDYYIFSVDSGFANRPVLAKSKTLADESRVFFDLHQNTDSGEVSIFNYVPDPTGRLVATNFSWAGSEWHEWRVIDVESGNEFPDRVRWVRRDSVGWTSDGRGFFYIRYPQASFAHESSHQGEIYFHRIGSKQEEDALVQEVSDAKKRIEPLVTEDGRYVLFFIRDLDKGTTSVSYKDLSAHVFDTHRAFKRAPTKKLVSDIKGRLKFIRSQENKFYFLTFEGSPKGRVVVLKLGESWEAVRNIIPEGTLKIQDVTTAGGRFFVNRVKDMQSQVEVTDLEGRQVGSVKNPGYGTLAGFEGPSKATEVFFSYTNFHFPELIYRYDIVTSEVNKPFNRALAFTPKELYTKLIYYQNAAGEMSPMLLTYRKNKTSKSQSPALLQIGGCANQSLTPRFSIPGLVWVEEGGVLAVPVLRGSTDLGEPAVSPSEKLEQATSDAIKAAEYLSKEWSAPKQIVLSAQGCAAVAASAAATEKPELFASLVLDSPLIDVFRYSHLEGGVEWTREFGKFQSEEAVNAFLKRAPLQAMNAVKDYPPALVSTAVRNRSISPVHAFKFLANLQANQRSKYRASLLRVDRGVTFGAWQSDMQQIGLALDQLSFAFYSVGHIGKMASRALVAERDETANRKKKSSKK